MPSDAPKPPDRLYRYEPFSTRSLLNLKSQIIHFGSPMNFNDPYDCGLLPVIKPPSDDEVEAIRRHYLAKPELSPAQLIEFEKMEPNRFREMLLRSVRSAIAEAREIFLNSRGVACFSEINDDLLMWSHYGDRYKGFCLGFDTSTDAFSKSMKVCYTPAMPTVNLLEFSRADSNLVQDLFCTKSLSWAYEKEWRVIHGVVGTEYRYAPESLTGVYFGPDIDEASREIICLIVRGQNATARFYKGSRSNSEYRVLFEEFTYTSHLEAKRIGWIK